MAKAARGQKRHFSKQHGQQPRYDEEKEKEVVRSPAKGSARECPPLFRIYQCYICAFFTEKRQDFIHHLTGSFHEKCQSGKVVMCNADSCLFRSGKPAKVTKHLLQYNLHYYDANTPACLLTFGPCASLMADDHQQEQEDKKASLQNTSFLPQKKSLPEPSSMEHLLRPSRDEASFSHS